MPKKPEPELTYLYELYVCFSGRDLRLVHLIEEKDRDRLLNYFQENFEKHCFFGLGGHEGYSCIVNTAHVTRINVLDYLAGVVQFGAQAQLTEKESSKRLEEREASDETIIIRIWLRGKREPIIHSDVEYESWFGICLALDGRPGFIEFLDEDRESVLYGMDHLDAIEMIDPFYLKEDQVEALLKRYENNPDKSPSDRDLDQETT